MTLCHLCRSIPSKFFSSARNDQCTVDHHENVAALELSAAEGCAMCLVLRDALQRRTKDGQLCDSMNGKPVDPTEQIHLRSTKFGEQWVCVGWSDVGNIRGMDVPQDWDDMAIYGQETKVGMGFDPKQQANTLKWWLEDCWSNHAECHKNHDSSYVPTRLVDVESSDPNFVRLVTTSKELMNDKRYIAASHCWGLNMPASAKTLASSLEQHTKQVSLQALSRTFVNFIEISRNIGIRYVWIDSLCIIQDSHQDWVTEAAQMAAVYSNAYVTLSASSSAGGNGGCRVGDPLDAHFGPVDLIWDQVGESEDTKSRTIRVFSKSKGQAVNVLMQDPLVKRGWTLQERELSPRVSHYSADTIRWECISNKATLEYPWKDTLPFNNALRAFDLGQLRPQGVGDWYGSEDVRKNSFIWFEVIERYTKRSLTKQTDILPVVSGIARYFSAEIGDKYHAGLFQSHGVIGLIWSIQGEWKNEKNKSSRPEEHLAPSWSWASVKGSVLWYWTLKRVQAEPVDHAFTPEILEISTIPSGEDPFGILKSGRLRIKGLMMPAFAMWREEDNLALETRAVLAMPPGEQLTKVGTINFDVPQEACQVILCLACRRESEYGWIDALGLVPTGQGSKEFKRVGLIRSKEKFWLEKAPTVEITIV
ncbi:heterokaryon incompatibility [Fusarium albosuccineum]|uniref:Heterokaryon incompatibility n=1 Tax=Fusarium albosuccineum TaxID=1237068 RepID=A0A8H4LF37_9HYPO|nr:heterokaryon incompatibility [Fusarium albosuccineum]